MTTLSTNARVVLTGPSGWIGQAMLGVLAKSWGGRLNGRVVAFGSAPRSMDLPWGEQLEVRELSRISSQDVAGAHVIHLAYLTKEKAELLGERAFTDTNLAIDDALLAAMQKAAPASLFVSSSGAASLAAEGRDMHPYGMAKLRQEARFLDWAAAASVPAIAGRIFNIAGPYINKLKSYAISNFALQARDAGEIRIEAQVPVFRSYLHVEDLCTLVTEAAGRGIGRRRPIDLCGTEIVEMGELAALVAEASHNSPQIRRGPVDHGRPSIYLGDCTHTKVLAMEIDIAPASLRSQIADTITWLHASTSTKNNKLLKIN